MKSLVYLLLLLFSAPLSARMADSSGVDFEVNVSKILMGTVVETTARYADITHCKQALLDAYHEMERVENLLSYQKSGSEISKINTSAGIKPVHVSEETFTILQRSVKYAEKLRGLFDITIGPVSSLWGFSSPEGGHLPPKKEIIRRLTQVDYRNLQLNTQDTTVFLKKKGMLIDLGGIAKGYAIDRASAVLKQNGITDFIVNAGGDIYVSGQKDLKTLWRIGVKDPRNEGELIARFDLKDYAVATSGDYERFIIVGGKRYHHIFDPRTGYPGQLAQSATTFAPTAEEADVLATFLFILGPEQAQQDKFTHPFLFVDASGQKIMNRAFRDLPGLE
jgi:thiamine biosynthesis lipoprotein